jgi:hypothetical protein
MTVEVKIRDAPASLNEKLRGRIQLVESSSLAPVGEISNTVHGATDILPGIMMSAEMLAARRGWSFLFSLVGIEVALQRVAARTYANRIDVRLN